MDRFVLSVLVENKAGVLSRVSGLFSRRGYNIDSLTVCETHNPNQSRMTIVVRGDEYILEQIQKQLAKLQEVISIKKAERATSVQREMALVKVIGIKDKPKENFEIIAGVISRLFKYFTAMLSVGELNNIS